MWPGYGAYASGRGSRCSPMSRPILPITPWGSCPSLCLKLGVAGFCCCGVIPWAAAVLYGALASHVTLALWSLYQRRRLRMSIWEAVQLLMGLTIPFLLTTHVVGTRLAHAWFNVQDSYTYVVLALWWYRPDLGVFQAIVLLLTWLHGCIGIHFWLRLQPWYGRVVLWLFGVAILLPTLALLGFVQAGREVAAQAHDAEWRQAILQETNAPGAAARQRLNKVRTVVPVAFSAAIGAILVARALRRRFEPRFETIQIIVSRWSEGRRASRLQCARSEPIRQNPTRLGVWRQGALLNVQGACRTRRSLHPSSQCGRTPCP